MKRTLSIMAAVVLLLGITTQTTDAATRHWRYVDSYIYENDSMGLWQVIAYYHVRMDNTYGLRPMVQQTAPMECVVSYSYLSQSTINTCRLDPLLGYSPPRWRVTVRWTTCLFGVGWWCSGHGMNLTFRASGTVTERRSW